MISLSTKKVKGLHENDFIMASQIDRLLDRGWVARPQAERSSDES
jgi:pterin-4a-carbinolamine dehydratase